MLHYFARKIRTARHVRAGGHVGLNEWHPGRRTGCPLCLSSRVHWTVS